MRDLQFIKNQVEPCFPPDYRIFEMHMLIYKTELQQRFDQILSGPKMDSLLTHDPDTILEFSGKMEGCHELLNQMSLQEDFFLNLQIRLEEYYPRFMDYAEGKIFDKLQTILEIVK